MYSDQICVLPQTMSMSGSFWHMHGTNMLEIVTRADGTSSRQWVFPSQITGQQTHMVRLSVRDQVQYSVGPRWVSEI